MASCSGPASLPIRSPPTASAPCRPIRSTSSGRWRPTTRFTEHRPPGRRDRDRPTTPTPCTSTSTSLEPGAGPLLPVHASASSRARPGAPARCPTARPGAVRPRRRQLPVPRDRHLRRLPAPASRSRSTSSLHLGDYIYEFAALAGPAGAAAGARPRVARSTSGSATPRTSSTPISPAAHARFPFVVTWDDHEVANNYMGDVLVEDPSPDGRPSSARPPRTGPGGSTCRCGSARPTATDLAVPRPSRSATSPASTCSTSARTATCRRAATPARRRLRRLPGSHGRGPDSARRRAGGLAGRGRWARAASPGTCSATRSCSPASTAAPTRPPYYLDTWDGFPDARRRLIEQLAEVDNPVVLTGDYHAGMVLDVHARAVRRRQPDRGAGAHGAGRSPRRCSLPT